VDKDCRCIYYQCNCASDYDQRNSSVYRQVVAYMANSLNAREFVAYLNVFLSM